MARLATLISAPTPQANPTQLDRLSAQAQQSANARGVALAIYNLNRVGAPMYVIRSYEPDATDQVAGPFYPNEGAQ